MVGPEKNLTINISQQDRLNLTIRETKVGENSWDQILPLAVLSLNTAIHKTTGYSPYELTYGRTNKVQTETACIEKNPCDLYAQALQLQNETAQAHAIANTRQAQRTSKISFDKRHRQLEFNIGDKVLVRTHGRQSKLADRFEGPFEIRSRENDVYQLACPENQKTIERHVKELKLSARQEQAEDMNRSTVVLMVALAGWASCELPETVKRGPTISWTHRPTRVVRARLNVDVSLRVSNPCPIMASIGSDTLTKNTITECTAVFHNTLIPEIKELENTRLAGHQTV